jgi:hypothetical protein
MGRQTVPGPTVIEVAFVSGFFVVGALAHADAVVRRVRRGRPGRAARRRAQDSMRSSRARGSRQTT